MTTNVWPRRRAAAVLLSLLVVPFLSGRARVLHGAQAVPAPALDRAIRANDLQKARLLVPENWTASEQLFVSYLERAYVEPASARSASDSRTRAERLAEVFFRIKEEDFAKAVVSTLDVADAARRQQLIDVVRDHMAALDHLRSAYHSAGPGESMTGPSGASVKSLSDEFTGVAGRYHALSFPRGELETLRQMINLNTGGAERTKVIDQLTDQLGDELLRARRRPYSEASLATAERLGLSGLQVQILYQLGSDASAAAKKPAGLAGAQDLLEKAVRYWERARMLSRSRPALETVNYWLFPAEAPRIATETLPALWNAYQTLNRPDQAQAVLKEALDISRPFGENAVLRTLRAFASSAQASFNRAETMLRTNQDAILRASRELGPTSQLILMRQMSGVTTYRPDIASEAVALALRVDNPHERAVTLEWFSRSALYRARRSDVTPGDVAALFPASYRQLRDVCVASQELELAADAVANEAEAYVYVRPDDPALATTTYRQAIQLAERSGNSLKVAQIANRAAEPPTGRAVPADQIALARIAAEAARKANAALELVRALRLGSETVEEMQQAVAAAVRYTEQSGTPAQELKSLSELATMQLGMGDYQAAVDTQRRRAERSRVGTAAKPGNFDEINAYEEIVTIYSELGEPKLARAAADQLRQVLETTVIQAERPLALQIARAYSQLGNIAATLGEPVEAMRCWDEALARLGDPTLKDTGNLIRRDTLEARATLNAQLGDFDASLKDWQDVGPLMASTNRNFYGFSVTGHTVAWKTAIAWTHALAGHADTALGLAREAAAELQGDTSGLWAGQWFNGQSAEERLLDIFLLTNHPEEAIPLYEALGRAPLINPARKRQLLGLQARTVAAANQPDRARALLTEALAIDRQDPGGLRTTGGSGDTLMALGLVELGAGDAAEAKRHLLEARDAVNPYDINRIWQTERALGVALVRTGDLAGAEARYERALTTLESIREQPSSQEFRLRYGFDRFQVYDAHAGLLAAKAAATGRQADAVQAFQAAERKRTQTLSALLATGWSRTPPQAIPDQVRRAMEMETRLGAKRAILREQFEQPPDKRDAVRIAKLEADVTQIQADHARLLATLAQSHYRYKAPANVAALLATSIRDSLGPSRVLVEYLLMEDTSYAFIVSGSGITVVPLAASRARVREQADQLLAPFRQLRAGDVDLTRLTYDTRAAYALYQSVFAPLRSALGSATEILIVPDDVLHVVPFEALVERPSRNVTRGGVLDAGFADEAFLIRRYAISYLTSSAELLNVAAALVPGDAPRRFFALANPTASAAPAPASAQDDPLKRQLRSAAFGAFLTPLPSAEAEVERIARFFPGASTVVTRDKATETAYTSQAGQYDIVHFATHGVASDSQPLYSTLVLAPDAAAGSDGFLQAYEVLRTPLRADLVVLSGCETALGGEDWGQGLEGLVAAFQQAGARSVLATLWTIDETTVDMMSNFYEALAQGQSESAALRQAKLKMLQQRTRMGKTEISLAHPFFWAPFKLVGVSRNQ